MRFSIALAVAPCLLAHSANAAGKIYYGSRAGMEVTIVSMSGIGTARAAIRVEHTPADAKSFCTQYQNDTSRKCVEETLHDTRINDVLQGNCVSGTFTSLAGEALRFVGENKTRSDMVPRYRILSAEGPLDASSASGYSVDLDQFRALCPNRVVYSNE